MQIITVSSCGWWRLGEESLADTSVSFCHLHGSSYSVPDLGSNYESSIKAMSRHQRSNTESKSRFHVASACGSGNRPLLALTLEQPASVVPTMERMCWT